MRDDEGTERGTRSAWQPTITDAETDVSASATATDQQAATDAPSDRIHYSNSVPHIYSAVRGKRNTKCYGSEAHVLYTVTIT